MKDQFLFNPLVFAGTIYKTDNSDNIASAVIAKSIFEALPPDQREKITSILSRSDTLGSNDWFYDTIYLLSTWNFPLDRLKKSLQELLAKDNVDIVSSIQEMMTEVRGDTYQYKDDDTNESWLRTVLNCREHDQANLETHVSKKTFSYQLRERDSAKTDFCKKFNIPFEPINLARFPFKAPVTYLQGDLDMITPAKDAFMHFEKVAERTCANLIRLTRGASNFTPG